MKRKQLLVATTLLVGTLITAVLRLQREDQPTVTPIAWPTPMPRGAAKPSISPVPLLTDLPVDQRKPKSQAMRDALSALNHKDIEFYGKVVDQHSAPIAGAEVNGQVIYNDGTASGVSKPKALTDSNGLFSFRGLKGRTLDFNITKPGYQFTPQGDAFDYTELVSVDKRHTPDPQNPVLLRMWKLQGAEPLIAFARKTFDLAHDGKPIRIDLMSGKRVAAGGDLVISLQHESWPRGSIERRHNWSATVRTVDGGAVETKERVMNLAPENGYLPELVFGEAANQEPWQGGAVVNLYVRSRGNIFSRIQLELHPEPSEPTSYVALRWWLNPKPGSRNVEYDLSKQASVP